MSHAINKPLRGWRFALLNWVLGLGHVLVLGNAGIYVSGVLHVAGTFAVPPSFASWGQTDHMLALSLAFPVANWFGRRAGEVRALVGAYLVFALSALLCAAADDFLLFLAGRMALGFAGGITIPLSQALILKEYPKRRQLHGISVWSLFTLTPAAFAPPLGGWIAENLGWRWLFYIDIPVALAVAGLTGALLYGRVPLRTSWTFDAIGGFLLATVALSLQTVLNQGSDFDWYNSRFLVGVTAAGVVAFVYLAVWELATPYPAIDLRLFGRRNFTIGIVCLTFGFLCFQGSVTFFIVKSQTVLGYPALQAGLAFLPMIVFLKPMAFLFHNFARRFDARLLASLSLLGFATAYFWIAGFDRFTSFEWIYSAHLLEALSLGSFFVPLTAIMLSGVPPKRHVRAVELAAFLRVAAGGLGISTGSILFEERTPFHQSRFVEHLTPLDSITGEVLDRLVSAGFSEQSALGKFIRIVGQHAQIRSINDVYWLAGCLCLGLGALVWLAHPTRPPAKPTPRQEVRRLAEEELVQEP